MQLQRTKGDCIAVEVIMNNVRIWLASPTGDSSDSHVVDIPCVTHSQAIEIAGRWRTVWGIDVS